MSLRRRHSSSDSSNSEADVIVIKKVYRPRQNYNFEHYFNFNERFRLSCSKAEEIINIIGPGIKHKTERNCALTPRQQLLTTLHWLGNGGQYHGVADMHGIDKSTVCRCVQRVSKAIVDLLYEDVVKWPNQIQEISQKFYAIAGMPRICGCIDGTLVNIDAPNNFEVAYVDRHGNHSINCMLVCGPDYTFYDGYVNWPGSVHDSRVLRRSPLYSRFGNGFRPFPNAVLLGDTGYPCKDWLLTPILRDTSPVIERYNRAHKSTRRIIENSIGILKEKFPCLKHLRLQPQKAVNIIKCCIALTNISKTSNDDTVEIPENRESENNCNSQLEEIDENEGHANIQYALSNFQ